RLPGAPPRARAAALSAPLAAAIAVYALDQRVLPRLYPFFHHGLGLCAFALCQGAALAAWRWRARSVPSPRVLLATALLVAAGAAAPAVLSRYRALPTITLERTQVAAPLL